MKPTRLLFMLLGMALATASALSFSHVHSQPMSDQQAPRSELQPAATSPAGAEASVALQPVPTPRPLPAFVDKGIVWLAQAQFPNGGWGAGTHARQEIRDPRTVQIDPATTAFAAMALLRTGNTLTAGSYYQHVSKALSYMLEVVDTAPEDGPAITTITGTQPQTKLGQHIDVAMAAQFFSRVLPHAKHDAALTARINQALDKCLRKLERTQNTDGSWNAQAWAPVLQSAMAHTALEKAQAAGKRIDSKVLERSRAYQKGNVDTARGEVKTDKAAGISLYALAGNQRATAVEAREAEQVVNAAKANKELDAAAPVSVDNLVKAGRSPQQAQKLFEAYSQNTATRQMLKDEKVLSGFGNNGGEEYLSYMLTSEALVVTGGKDWDEWYHSMSQRLAKVQNANGSWSGHHCITSPVFSTAAVILTVTADREVDVLRHEQQHKAAKVQ